MQGRKRERSLNSGTRVGQVTLKEQVSSGGESSENGTKTGSKTKATTTTTKTKQQKSASTRTFRDQFISVAIRVSAYPIAREFAPSTALYFADNPSSDRRQRFHRLCVRIWRLTPV